MAWVTPINDRVLSDITTPTAKGLWNVADWTRVDGNTAVIKAMLDAAGYLDIPLYSLTPPTITTIPEVADMNHLIENIERLAQSACLPALIGLAALVYNFLTGANATAPYYTDANDWEGNQKKLYEAIPRAISYRISCGVAAAGQVRTWQHRFR
jgi:hypothetical protein